MTKKIFQWAVVGAGPAGIAAVGKLIDFGIAANTILWIDPHFRVGDLGMLWRNVSSNTTVQRFLDFLKNAQAFAYDSSPIDFQLNHLSKEETCPLSEIATPLLWVSQQLGQRVKTEKTIIHSIRLSERTWTLNSEIDCYKASNVILATGSVPSSLCYPGIEVVPFNLAIDKEQLANYADKNETYGVFGSSHSAIIIVQHLVDLAVKKIINFYRSPCRYAVDMGDWILFDNTGLKGQTAAWARENIDGQFPANLARYNSSELNIARYLPECDKLIYAVGFERRNSIIIERYEQTNYNPHLGIIGPGLFGLGIAYPEIKADPFGCVESQIGLWKFMAYLNKIIPVWLKYHS